MQRRLSLLCAAALLLAGCALPAKSPAPAETPASPQPAPATAPPDQAAAKPAPAQPTSQLPALPLWGPPGLHLTEEKEETGLSFAYAPVKMLGYTLQPVLFVHGTAFLRVEEQAVYLHGFLNERGGYAGLPEPRLLYRLPLKVGDEWDIDFPATGGSTERYTYRVAAVEPVQTPGGERLAAKLQVVSAREKETEWEWWVPGYGLVRRATDNLTWTAAKERRREPDRTAVIGRLAKGLEALLWDDGKSFRVTTLDGKQELFREQDSYWRSWYSFREAGEVDLLAHTHDPGVWYVYAYEVQRYNPETARFEAVPWVSSAGTSKGVSGQGKWGPDGLFTLTLNMRYPLRIYPYRFDGKAMRTDPAEEKVIRVQSAQKLVERLFTPPALGKADFVATFKDPAAGEKAWQAMWEFYGPRGPIGGASVKPVAGETDTFLVEDGKLRVKVKVEKGAADFQATGFEVIQKP
jgi:hypothetical protein